MPQPNLSPHFPAPHSPLHCFQSFTLVNYWNHLPVLSRFSCRKRQRPWACLRRIWVILKDFGYLPEVTVQVRLEKKITKITLEPEGLESDTWLPWRFSLVLSVFFVLTSFSCCKLTSSTWWGILAHTFSALSSESFSRENPREGCLIHSWTTQSLCWVEGRLHNWPHTSLVLSLGNYCCRVGRWAIDWSGHPGWQWAISRKEGRDLYAIRWRGESGYSKHSESLHMLCESLLLSSHYRSVLL